MIRRDTQRLPSSPSKSRWGGGFRSVLVSLLVILALTSVSALAIDPLPFKDHAEEVRFQNLARQLRCLVCQNQDLADSEAPLAGDLRKQVFDMMRAGKSDAEIKQYLVARYNDFVLYDPPLKPGTWLLWFAPFAFVLIGALVLARIVRTRARAAAAESGQSHVPRTSATTGGASHAENDSDSKDDDW